MNKKGFVFIETIIVITVLVTSLLLIYGSFSNVLNSEKTRVRYDDTAYVYRTLYIKKFLENNNVGVLYNKVDTNNLVSFNCAYDYLVDDEPFYDPVTDSYIDNANKSFCEEMLSLLNTDNLYMTHYNIDDYKNCNDFETGICSDLKYLDEGYFSYLKTLNTHEDTITNGYRLIASFKNKKINNTNCLKNNDGDCLIFDINEQYYASLKMVDDLRNRTTYDVSIIVTNGNTLNSLVKVLAGRSIGVKLIGDAEHLVNDKAVISCTNGQTGLIDNSKLIINSVTNNTECTISLESTCSVALNTDYTYAAGISDTFTAPCSGRYNVTLEGAAGGGANGGKGARVQGIITLSKGDSIQVNVGSPGGNTTGGFNGGGNPLHLNVCGGGGGATDIRIGGSSLNDRIMVAAGGGGSSIANNELSGGAGSTNGTSPNVDSNMTKCATGYNECNNVAGGYYLQTGACPQTVIGDGCYGEIATGGTQNNGGKGSYTWVSPSRYTSGNSGSKGIGGSGICGGGAGYFGGGGGAIYNSYIIGGAGGSSCVSGSTNYSCSNISKTFTNTVINGGTTTNGRAVITYIGD